MPDETHITTEQATRSFYATARTAKAQINAYTDEYGRGRCFYANGYLYILRKIDGKPVLTLREDHQ